MKEDKVQLEEDLKQSKDYIRKLENKLISGLKYDNNGNALMDMLNQVKEQLKKVTKEKQ